MSSEWKSKNVKFWDLLPDVNLPDDLQLLTFLRQTEEGIICGLDASLLHFTPFSAFEKLKREECKENVDILAFPPSLKQSVLGVLNSQISK